MKNYFLDKLMECKGDVTCVLVKLKYLKINNYSFTTEEIANILKISKQRVREIEKNVLRKLKHPKIRQILTGVWQ